MTKIFTQATRYAVLQLLLLCGVFSAQAQMTLTTGNTADELAQKLAGEGVEVFNATLNPGCALTQRGTFAHPPGLSDIGIDSGIVLTTGIVDNGTTGINRPYSTFISGSTSSGTDPDLASLITFSIFDACVLEFDFIPKGDTVKFNYVFGSEEYPEWACSSKNDVFGFFISGGFYPGPTNIALVPGTTIPVAINSINKAPAGTSFDVSTCMSMGAGSPFGMYYVDNEDVLHSPSVVYDGFTTILQAVAAVTPCDTFHLKIAIADGDDPSFDSGVFLEAGSLKSTALEVQTFGGAGFEVPYTNCVRGCPPGKFTVTRSGGTGSSIDVPYSLEGTAVNGVDYEFLPGVVTIPAGSASADVLIEPIVFPYAVGPKSVIVKIYSPYTCDDELIVLSSDTITIFDSMYVKFLQPDTTICRGESVYLEVETDTLFNISWTPSAFVDDPTGLSNTVSPSSTMTYGVTINMEGVACPASSDFVTITVKNPPTVDLGPDLKVCLDGGVMLNPMITPEPDEDFTYSWTPTTGLSDPTIRNPIASPTISTNYVLTVNPGAEGCEAKDTILVQVLPNDITLVNTDQTVCEGTVVPLNVSGHPDFTYRWTDETDILEPHMQNTAVVANYTRTITVTASHPGCFDMTKSFDLTVEPNPDVDLGEDRVICMSDTVHLYASVDPHDFDGYTYTWTPGIKLSDSTIKNPIFNGYSSEEYIVKVETPLGCFGVDTIEVIVNPSQFITVNFEDTVICNTTPLQILADGGVKYQWSPSWGLNNDTIKNPLATPNHSTLYTLVAENEFGCLDTQLVNIHIAPSIVSTMPDSVDIWPGETYEIDLVTNGHYFNWFPPEGLSNTTIPNPIASPDVRTRYFVNITGENGCSFTDSIDIIVHLESIFDVPNAFVPGNSNVNNGIFKIEKRGLVTLDRFQIFNRWGNLVFETNDINQGWDGRYNGEPQPKGVYVYQIEGTLNTGRKVTLQGNVTLIR